MRVCGRCGRHNPVDARFCNACGTALAAQAGRRRVERKVVSVLFADLVSHTAASEGLDPEEVWNTLETYHGLARAVLTRHGGTVEKFIGDAVMAVFGAPVVREDDPQRAVRAALELRDEVVAMARRQQASRMAVRVGVNTGEVVVALDSDPAAGQGIVFGDIVNTAAKLQQGAPVNAVVAGESTVRATEQAIVYRPLEAVRPAGRAAPLPVWEVLGARDPDEPASSAFSTPFVGRRTERDHVVELVHRACAERSPQLVNVLGVPGIGKSRLVAEALAAADTGRETMSIRTGRSLPLGPGAGFGAVAEIVKSWAGIRAADRAAEAEAKLTGALSDAGIDGDDRSWMIRHLRPLVGLAADAATVPDRHVESFAAWRRLFEALAERRPTVLVFEDLHWADDALLDFIEHVIEWSADVPLVVVGTARPELLERRPKFGHGTGATSLTLEPLPPIQSAELIAALFGEQPVSGAVTDTVLAGSVGNPLFAVEWVRMLRDRASAPESPRTPDTIEAIVAARLDTLAPDDKELLQDASVVGRSFAAGAVAAIAELPVDEVDERLRGLELRQFIQRDDGSVDPHEARYAFAHTLVRDATYAQIPRARRSGKHRMAAEWVASLSPDRAPDRADLLAHHYVTALDLARAAGSATATLEMRTRIALKEAGDVAHALGAFATAARRYEAAIELWPATEDDGERGETLLRWGEAVQIVDGSGAEILADARDVLLAAGRREPAARAEVLLGDLARTRGDTPSAWRHVEHAAALVDELPPSPATAYVLANLARIRGQASRNTEAIAIAKRAQAMADTAGDEPLGQYAASIVGLQRVVAGDPDGFDDLDRAVAVASTAPPSLVVFRIYGNCVTAATVAGDRSRHEAMRDAQLEVARRLGYADGVRWLTALRIADQFKAGDWDEALRGADDFITATAASPHFMEILCRWVRSQVRIGRGDVPGGLADASACERLSGANNMPPGSFEARMLIDSGRRVEAGAVIDRFLAEASPSWVANTDFCLDTAIVLAELGRGTDLFAAVADQSDSNPKLDAARDVASGAFAAAIERLEAIGEHVDAARVELLAAERLAAEGASGEAMQHCEAALAFYRRVSAAVYTCRAENLAAALARESASSPT